MDHAPGRRWELEQTAKSSGLSYELSCSRKGYRALACL